MWALVTGASSGIGRDMARYLYLGFGYNLIIVARNEDRLLELKQELESKFQAEKANKGNSKNDNNSNKNDRTNISVKDNSNINQSINESNANTEENMKINRQIIVIKADLSNLADINNIVEKTTNIDVDLLVNNAGFGVFGNFVTTNLEKEVNLINTNITAVHILTKVFLNKMKNKNRGHILNVASVAGMEPGPLMAAYYASKAYVIRLSRAINKELRKDKSNVKISILCPGPVDTNFNNVANVVFKAPSMPSEKVAKYGIDKALKGKLIIVPGFLNKCVRFFSKILPDAVLEEVAYHIQRRKGQN